VAALSNVKQHPHTYIIQCINENSSSIMTTNTNNPVLQYPQI